MDSHRQFTNSDEHLRSNKINCCCATTFVSDHYHAMGFLTMGKQAVKHFHTGHLLKWKGLVKKNLNYNKLACINHLVNTIKVPGKNV